MRWLVPVIAVAAALAQAGAAHAGGFGGFSHDGTRYLAGTDRVCTLLAPTADAAPQCERADARAVAAGKFRPGEQQVASKGFSAEARGRRIVVFAPGRDKPVVEWNAGAVVSRVIAVYAAADGARVAIEFEARELGRLETRAVAFRLGAPAATRAQDSPPAPTETRPAPPAPGTTTPEQRMKATEARRRADKLLARRRYKQARAGYEAALAVDSRDFAARYGVAVAAARMNKRADALEALGALHAAADDEAGIYLLEARSDGAFRRLRDDPAYRRYVGLDRAAPKDRSTLTAYERLLGPGGTWEQAEVTCEQARVTLSLTTRERSFALRIESKCNGYKDVTKLDGRWETEGARRLLLVMPNPDEADDQLLCSIETCGGEDCVRCKVDADLDFLLRPARR